MEHSLDGTAMLLCYVVRVRAGGGTPSLLLRAFEALTRMPVLCSRHHHTDGRITSTQTTPTYNNNTTFGFPLVKHARI